MVTISGVWPRRRGRATTRRIYRPLGAQLARAAGRYLAGWRTARTAVLTWAGIGLVDVAAFQLHLVAGLVTTGVSLLVLEWLGRE